MSFLKGLFARRLTATSFLTLKKCGKNDLLKNTKQVHRTCVGNHQFLKLEKQILRISWEIRGIFFHDKKEFKREKIFQTCTMNIRGIFFHDVFFFCRKKSTELCPTLAVKAEVLLFSSTKPSYTRGIQTACVYKNFGSGNTMKVVLPSQRQGSDLNLRRLTS